MKILIVKTSSLGDIIHTYPVVDFLRAQPAVSEIHWVVEDRCKELVESHKGIDKTWIIDTGYAKKSWWRPSAWSSLLTFRRAIRETRFDLVLDLQGNCKSAVVVALTKASITL